MENFYTVCITFKPRNVFLTLSDKTGRCLKVESLGKYGVLRSSKVKDTFGQQFALMTAIQSWALTTGFGIKVCFYGYDAERRRSGLLKFLIKKLAEKFVIISIEDKTKIPFNGCRLSMRSNRKKVRRHNQ